MFVGFLGSPLLAGDTGHRGRLLAPVSFTIPEHAVCREERMVVSCHYTDPGDKEQTQQC